MGAACCKSGQVKMPYGMEPNDINNINNQTCLMDNNEARIFKINTGKPKPNKKEPAKEFDGFLQRQQYFVFP